MNMFHEVHGQGPDLVLLHGWGLHGGFWRQTAERLARDFRIHVLDLPGHGRSKNIPCPGEISELAGMIADAVGGPAIWMGWSLGGLVSLEAAIRLSSHVTRLVLVGATPRFVQGPDWPHAMDAGVFAGFADDLAGDYRGTIRRFLSLQAGSDEYGRQLIKQLRQEVYAHGDPDVIALRNGLTLLEQSDLRTGVPCIQVPALVVHGQHDRLAPPEAGRWLATHLHNARFDLLDGAGHAPFLSHPQRFLETVQGFLA